MRGIHRLMVLAVIMLVCLAGCSVKQADVFEESAESQESVESSEGEEIPRKIQIVNLAYKNAMLEQAVKRMDASFGNMEVTYAQGYAEDQKKRTLVEVSSGGGPDLLVLSREDFLRLQELGLLAKMNPFLNEDIEENLLAGARQIGTVGDELYGVPFDFSGIQTLVTSKNTWDQDGWTISDVIGLVEEKSELQGIFLSIFGEDTFYHNTYIALGFCLPDFLDAEGSKFDYETLKRVLTTIKKKASDNGYEDIFEMIHEQKFLACQYSVASLTTYCILYKRTGKDMRLVGYPTTSGWGNFLQDDDGILVINQASAGKAGIKEAVQYLFGRDCQMMVAGSKITGSSQYSVKLSVRYDIPELCLQQAGESYITVDGEEVAISEYLQEYLTFLNSAIPKPVYPEEILDIIQEEAESYFHDGKSLEQTMEVIKSRIDLFLLEK